MNEKKSINLLAKEYLICVSKKKKILFEGWSEDIVEAYENGMKDCIKMFNGRCDAISLMHYIDKHRPAGKMCLSNMECEDIKDAFINNDWGKVIRYIHKYEGGKQ